MNRDEAVGCLKEIEALSKQMSPQAITLEKSAIGVLEAYKVRITGLLVEEDKQIVRNVAQKHCLEVSESFNALTIY